MNPSAADSVWAYLTSVKRLRKKDGRVDEFLPVKLERSIRAAFLSVGASSDLDRALAHLVTQRVVQRVTETFDGHTVASALDLRNLVEASLLEHGLHHVARHYVNFHKHAPMMNPNEKWNVEESFAPVQTSNAPRRKRLNEERKAITHKFQVGTHEGYLTVGLYDDTRQPGEIFMSMSKEGSMMSGLVDAFATSISIGLQYGVPLKVFVNKFANMRFEPSGMTQNPNIPKAKSIVDYVFRWLALKFLTPEERQAAAIAAETASTPSTAHRSPFTANLTDEQPKLIDPSGFEASTGGSWQDLPAGRQD